MNELCCVDAIVCLKVTLDQSLTALIKISLVSQIYGFHTGFIAYYIKVYSSAFKKTGKNVFILK